MSTLLTETLLDLILQFDKYSDVRKYKQCSTSFRLCVVKSSREAVTFPPLFF